MTKHTDTSRSGDLVAAMKDQIESWEFEDPRETWWKWQHQYAQAADCIEEQDRHLTLSGKVSKALSERIEALEAENERLRGALRNIRALATKRQNVWGPDGCLTDIECFAIAALAGDSHD